MARNAPGLYLKDLKPGDVILSRAKFNIPGGWESALIVLLDGGRYSHAALFNGEAFIEMITPGIVASAPRVKTHVHRFSDVYRFHDTQGWELDGRKDLPSKPVTVQAGSYLNTVNAYGYNEALMVAVVLILRGALIPRWAQPLVEVVAGIVLTRLKRLIDLLMQKSALTMTCSELVSECFWQSSDASGDPYGLRIRVGDRHKGTVHSVLPGLQSRLNQLTEELSRLQSAYPGQLEIARSNLHESNDHASLTSGIEELIAGSSCLPSNCVTPCDLQVSHSLRFMGRYLEGVKG